MKSKRRIEVTIQGGNPPSFTWKTHGFLPFQCFGERFAVTPVIGQDGVWHATHIATGVAVPNTKRTTKKAVPNAAKAYLRTVGEAKFNHALRVVQHMIKKATKS